MHVASRPMVRIAVTAVLASSARMARVGVAAASVLASLVLVACGGGDGNRPLSPNNAEPFAQKQRTLTPAEYPAMREWIVLDSASAETAGPVCDALEAAPDTRVIRAAHNLCVQAVSTKTAALQLNLNPPIWRGWAVFAGLRGCSGVTGDLVSSSMQQFCGLESWSRDAHG